MRMIKSFSMSGTKKDAERTITALNKTIAQHIMLCIVFNDSLHVKHWLNEISDRLETIHDAHFIKKGAKLKLDRIYELLHPGKLDHELGILDYLQKAKESKTDLRTADFTVPTSTQLQSLYVVLTKYCYGNTFSRTDCEFILRREFRKLFSINL